MQNINLNLLESYTWSKSFLKSISENSQIVFSKKMTVATINQDTLLPFSDVLDIQEIVNLENLNNSALISLCDNRTIFYNNLRENTLVHISIYFPLSREKYKLNCVVVKLSGDGKDMKSHHNLKQIQSYFKSNYNFTNNTNGLDKNEEEYLKESLNYLEGVENAIMGKKEEKLNLYWNKLNNEDKLSYESVDKDSIIAKDEIVHSTNEVKDDLSKFEAQEEIFYSKHFSLLYFIPLDVEHSIYPMPQVVANSRKPNFESLYKPHKKAKKFMFMLNVDEKSWTFKELYA